MKYANAATSLHHLAVRIAHQRPEAFKEFSLFDILSLFKQNNDLGKNLVEVFGIRGGFAAFKLIQIGLSSIRADPLEYELLDADNAKAMLYPIWTKLGWSNRELNLALAALIGVNRQRKRDDWVDSQILYQAMHPFGFDGGALTEDTE